MAFFGCYMEVVFMSMFSVQTNTGVTLRDKILVLPCSVPGPYFGTQWSTSASLSAEDAYYKITLSHRQVMSVGL